MAGREIPKAPNFHLHIHSPGHTHIIMHLKHTGSSNFHSGNSTDDVSSGVESRRSKRKIPRRITPSAAAAERTRDTDAPRACCPNARIVVVSSIAHRCADLDERWMRQLPKSYTDGRRLSHELEALRQRYSCHGAYARSKLALHAVAAAIAKRCNAAGLPVAVHTVDPGIVDTRLYRHVHWALRPVQGVLAPLLFRSAQCAAAGVAWAALSSDLEGETGGYYAQGVPAVEASLVKYAEASVWQLCCEADDAPVDLQKW
jgi:NAD(P)-dependent dehydrogenase (short-subunit alcohol dehydrogenase family)